MRVRYNGSDVLTLGVVDECVSKFIGLLVQIACFMAVLLWPDCLHFGTETTDHNERLGFAYLGLISGI